MKLKKQAVAWLLGITLLSPSSTGAGGTKNRAPLHPGNYLCHGSGRDSQNRPFIWRGYLWVPRSQSGTVFLDYTYTLDGGPYDAWNAFRGLEEGAYCPKKASEGVAVGFPGDPFLYLRAFPVKSSNLGFPLEVGQQFGSEWYYFSAQCWRR